MNHAIGGVKIYQRSEVEFENGRREGKGERPDDPERPTHSAFQCCPPARSGSVAGTGYLC